MHKIKSMRKSVQIDFKKGASTIKQLQYPSQSVLDQIANIGELRQFKLGMYRYSLCAMVGNINELRTGGSKDHAQNNFVLNFDQISGDRKIHRIESNIKIFFSQQYKMERYLL